MSALRPVREHGPAVGGGLDLDLPGVEVRLRATRWPARGCPVVLLHGLASTRRFWNLVVPDLAAAGLYVVALDARGHGESEQPSTGYDMASVTADVATALDALGLSRAVVVGHSWGGAVALAFAAAYPHRTLAVVALDGGFAPPPAPDDRAAVRIRLEPPRWVAAPAEVVERLRHGPLAAYWDEDRERALLPIFGVGDDGQARARLPAALHLQILDALLDHDPAHVLPLVECPGWLVDCAPVGRDGPDDNSADRARWTRRKADGLAAAATLLRSPRLLTWRGALHDVPLQWPAAVSGLVRAATQEATEQATGEPPPLGVTRRSRRDRA